jgi:hypothetical protein
MERDRRKHYAFNGFLLGEGKCEILNIQKGIPAV